MGHRGWKGERVMGMLGNFHFPHTFAEGFDVKHTCVSTGRREPKQMDYMATTAPRRWTILGQGRRSSTRPSLTTSR